MAGGTSTVHLQCVTVAELAACQAARIGPLVRRTPGGANRTDVVADFRDLTDPRAAARKLELGIAIYRSKSQPVVPPLRMRNGPLLRCAVV
ncbi:hypothetical protein GCM10010502_72890 [Kitasatospora aureofaciens]|uniref:Uncharacterized protein n=1 Tax=Kitasatospora aureofaciens TaxID=1894 RepID=A0A8H9I0W5_KITAU|nr:hypothetical protein GCM10010502_72890 [Kitasatospora aureofaciens]